ncbi:MAG: translation initiation factor IF-3 [Muribaculaceae bacterium]|nr:translation initiation factor IF-3 [Muribaculaceae bacterium]
MNKKPYRPGPKRPSNASRPRGRNRQMGGKNDKDTNLINDEIRASEVRLVGDNVEQGIYPIEEALKIAEGQELDLILIAPQAEPPVCRVMDYQKFKFQQRKHAKEQKAKSTKLVVKEIRFGPQTDEHDYNFKLKHAIGFLKEGAKVKSYVFFKGRSILFKEQGEVLLLRFANDLEEYGKLDQMPVLEGKRMTIMISPKKPGSKKKEEAKGAPEADTAAQQDNTPDKE